MISRWAATTLVGFSLSCGPGRPDATIDLNDLAWEEIERSARGQTVSVAMWQGDPYINRYMQEWVAPRLEERYGVRLRFVSLFGNQIVSALMTELEARKPASEYDLIWINGETFYQLRQIEALYGPFTDRLPNARYIDFDNPFIALDFQQPIEGYEAPWGNVQFILIYDSARVSRPPRNREELALWVQAHPGRFTFDESFAGMTFLKSLLMDFAGGGDALLGPFDKAKYEAASAELWTYLQEIKPYLWKKGRSFPAGVAQLHQLFINGEVDLTMSNNDGELDNKVLQGLFPETARAYVLDSGTIQNSHYWGIVKNASHKEGALVAIDLLVSPEAQYEKVLPSVWGDGTVLDIDRLPPEWQEKFRSIPARRYAPPRPAIEDKALPELAPEYMIRVYDDFRAQVTER